MKVICLLCDSLNRHFLSAYGQGVAETPNLDWLAQRAWVFDRHFSGSLPTMPTRREVWTGNYEFLWRSWGALEPWDRDLPGLLAEHGILTMLITDSYHLFENGSGNYHINFDGWEFFRGFENDPWVTEPTPMPAHKGNLNPRYARNMRRMQQEEDLPPAKTLRCVERWLQKNYMHEQFFLMIDEFAPHEPFNTPDYLVRKYDPDYQGPLLFWPDYGKHVHTEREVRHLRAAYAAHVELIDKYLGRVFETMSDLDMWQDTAFILMTDHGHFLGEHGMTGKPSCPPYNTLVHIPFMLALPGGGGGRHVDALSGNVDVFATVLDLFGLQSPAPVHSRSLLPLVRGGSAAVRDWSLYGYFGRGVGYVDNAHTYIKGIERPGAALNLYSLGWNFGRYAGRMPPLTDALEVGRFMRDVPVPVGRLPLDAPEASIEQYDGGDHLYDLNRDPEQQHNLAGGADEAPYREALCKALAEVDCPAELYTRLGLDTAG
ncbi:MAG: sulfatase-like hydrolase/transferase [Lentisphaerae bacterium]|nr:sulfatase-like hydrolase/transferase [Lentisphaerota bacterium]